MTANGQAFFRFRIRIMSLRRLRLSEWETSSPSTRRMSASSGTMPGGRIVRSRARAITGYPKVNRAIASCG